MVDYTEFARQCEEWLRNGHSDKVSHALTQIVVANIPRAKRVQLANFARRASLIPLGLRILTPVFGEHDSGIPGRAPQPEEWAEMGVLLHKSGSTSEALTALSKARGVPEALLYTAFCHFSRWDSHLAVEPLRQYTHQPGLTIYQRAVGYVNLIAAYTALKQPDEARRHLEPSMKFVMDHKFPRLTANLIEITAQLDIEEKNYAAARNKLNESSHIFLEDDSSDRLYVKKLLAQIDLIETGNANAMSDVRAAAVQLQHWETIRSCDLHLLKYRGSQALFERVYFGSPFPALRAELKRDYAAGFTCPTSHVTGQGKTVDLATGEFEGSPIFKGKRKVHDLCAVLFSDFYRPFRVGALFAGVFPGEHYNIAHGPDRIYQLMLRLREVLNANGVQIQITQHNGFFRARPAGDCAVRVREEASHFAGRMAPILRLQNAFPTKTFTSKDAREALAMPYASLARMLQQGVKDGLIVREGAGIYTRYRIAG